jgi:hypothetical protein
MKYGHVGSVHLRIGIDTNKAFFNGLPQTLHEVSADFFLFNF